MITHYETMSITKKPDIVGLLKEVEGQSLSVVQIAQMTGLSHQQVKKEVEKLVYSGKNVCYHKGYVFLANSKAEFPIYLVLLLTTMFIGTFTLINMYL